jgi:hypothetical protein
MECLLGLMGTVAACSLLREGKRTAQQTGVPEFPAPYLGCLSAKPPIIRSCPALQAPKTAGCGSSLSFY